MNSEIVKYNRLLIIELPKKQSAFLWGARKTGKSTYLAEHFADSQRYDLLKSDLFLRLMKAPHQLREEVLALSAEQLSKPIIIDEVQKIPALLDEVHWLIENTDAQFILCGSSARKLKRNAANLLGGRAWRFEFYPLTYSEIPNFNLSHALNTGLIPLHYLQADAKRSLRAYIEDYVKEEIQGEGLVRNLPAFARFMDTMAYSHGEMTNFSNIARDCGVDSKTVKEYYQILIDTLLGYYIYPYRKKSGRETILAAPKFYLFDVGVAGFLSNRHIEELKGVDAGHAFEHYIFMELVAYRGLKEQNFEITYWRTKTGLEVDFVLGNASIAIEVKISDSVRKSDIKGLLAFQEEYKPDRLIVVCMADQSRKLKDENFDVDILPWSVFLEDLWDGKII